MWCQESPREWDRFKMTHHATARNIRKARFYPESLMFQTRRMHSHDSLVCFYAGLLLLASKANEAAEALWGIHSMN